MQSVILEENGGQAKSTSRANGLDSASREPPKLASHISSGRELEEEVGGYKKDQIDNICHDFGNQTHTISH